MNNHLVEVIKNVEAIYQQIKQIDQQETKNNLEDILNKFIGEKQQMMTINIINQLLIKVEKNNEKGIQICNILQFNSNLSQQIIQIFIDRYLNTINTEDLDNIDAINILKIISQSNLKQQQTQESMLNKSIQIIKQIHNSLQQINNTVQVYEIKAKYLELFNILIGKMNDPKSNLKVEQLICVDAILMDNINLLKLKTIQIIGQKQQIFLNENNQFIINKYTNTIYCNSLLIILRLFINSDCNNQSNSVISDHFITFWKYIKAQFCRKRSQIMILQKICEFFMLQNDSLFNIVLQLVISNNLLLQNHLKDWDLVKFISMFDEETLINLFINDSSLLEIMTPFAISLDKGNRIFKLINDHKNRDLDIVCQQQEKQL